MVDMKELEAQYGRLMIQAEIIQGQINSVKQAIVQEINKPRVTDDKTPTEKA